MSFPTKTKVPVAVTSRSQQDVSGQHVTTTDFMQLNVAYAQELVPGQKLNFKHELFTRLEPLAVPTFGRAEIQNRVFWVPFRTIMSGWNDFITDSPHVYNNGIAGLIPNVPLVSNTVLLTYLTSPSCASSVTLALADFVVDGVGGQTPYKLNNRGRLVYKTLRALGYAPILDTRISKMYSALPLLALFKIYCDWYYPSAYDFSAQMSIMRSLFTKNNEITSFDSYLQNNHLSAAFECIESIAYDDDYFTSSWDNPTGPNTGLSSSFQIPDVTAENINSVSNGALDVNTPVVEQTDGGSITTISHYILDALHSLSDYLRRHQIAGSKTIDRYLARWGYKLSSEKLNRSVLVNSYNQTIQFGDVTATSDTAAMGGAHLGAYAGKGLSFGNGYTEFDTNDEYGMFIVLSTVIPKVEYYQGINRQVLHTTKLDFFTPEFDGLGTQAQSAMELYVPFGTTAPANIANLPEKVFGFTPRYAEYKVGHSLITGDYVLESMNTGKDSWTLFRDVSSYVDDVDNLAHSYDFVVSKDKSQYNRIFWNTDDNADHFNVIHNFNISSSFPGKSLYDDYEYKEEGKANKVTLDVGGTTLN